MRISSLWPVRRPDLSAITGLGRPRYVFENHACGLPIGETKCKNFAIKAENSRRIIRGGRNPSRAGNTFVRDFRNPQVAVLKRAMFCRRDQNVVLEHPCLVRNILLNQEVLAIGTLNQTHIVFRVSKGTLWGVTMKPAGHLMNMPRSTLLHYAVVGPPGVCRASLRRRELDDVVASFEPMASIRHGIKRGASREDVRKAQADKNAS